MNLGVVKQTPIFIAAGVIALVCLLQALHHEFLERLEWMTYDWRVRQAVRHSPQVVTNLGFLEITDDTIVRLNNGSLGFNYGLYWPRHVYGRVVNELKAEGAQAIAFDVMFGGLRPDHATVMMPDESALNSDEYFARAMKAAGNVIIAADQGVVPAKLFGKSAMTVADISTDRDNDGVLRRGRAFNIYREWHFAFQQLANDPAMGVRLDRVKIETNRIILMRPSEHGTNQDIIFPLTKDGDFDMQDFVGTNLPPKVRRFAKPYTESRKWNMGIVMAAKELGLDLANADINLPQGRIILFGTNGLRRIIPVDHAGYFYINWCLRAADPRLTHEPFEALLARHEGRTSGETNKYADYFEGSQNWSNKLVLIGSSATGNDLTDKGATPLEKDTLLMSEHWNVANSVLTDQFVRRSSLPLELGLIVAMGILGAFLTWFFRSSLGSLASFSIIISAMVYVVIALQIYLQFRFWVPIVMPVIGGLFTTHFCLLVYHLVFEQAERRRVRSIFSKMVSPDIVAEMLKTEKLSLTGTPRKVTVFFSDIRGFTEMTDVNRDKAAEHIKANNLTGDAAKQVEDRQASETLDTVNKYLKVIAEVVLKHGGTVDKFIGDCVMAFWGAPGDNPKHALCCVRAAIDTQRAVHKLNQEREAENRRREAQNRLLAAEGKPLLQLQPILVVGTGINTGDVTAGLMGSDERVNYTVFGREVNLASRLESVSGRARVIISEATLAEIIQDDPTLALSCQALPPVTVKGIRDAVKIYEVPWRENPPAGDTTAISAQPAEYPGHISGKTVGKAD